MVEGVKSGENDFYLLSLLLSAPGHANKNTRGRSKQLRTGKGYVYSGQMTSVSAVLFSRACARACERDRARVCVCADDSAAASRAAAVAAAAAAVGHTVSCSAQYGTKHTHGGL